MDQDYFYGTPVVTNKHRNKPLVAILKDLLEVPSGIGDTEERKTAGNVGNLGSRNTKEDISSRYLELQDLVEICLRKIL
jgi:hypothetical protein